MVHDPLSGKALELRLKDLATLTDVEGEMNRLSLSPAHRQAAAKVRGWFEAAGMTTHLDATGSVVGRYEAAEPGAKTLLIGSHIDTVRRAGIYDGNLGVITGLAVVEALHKAGRRLPFALEVIAFADEEGVRFPTTLSSSKAVAGTFNPTCLDEIDREGVSRREALLAFGAEPERWAKVKRDPATILGYVEVHIEQGPVLEKLNRPCGVVTAINGCSRGLVTLKGYAGHAGTLPMTMRQDALAAAAEMVLAVEARGKAEADLVATVGTLHVGGGGAVNVVPGAVQFSLDIRSPEDEARHKAVQDLRDTLQEIAARRQVSCSVVMNYDTPACPCDTDLQQRLAEASAACGYQPVHLPSGAGHDAMAFRGVFPTAMLFVRCKGGVSHNPAEYAAPADMEAGARVLMRMLENWG